jgi:hypothetical protein
LFHKTISMLLDCTERFHVVFDYSTANSMLSISPKGELLNSKETWDKKFQQTGQTRRMDYFRVHSPG